MLFSVGFLTPFFFGLGSCVSAAGMAPLAVRIGLDLAEEGDVYKRQHEGSESFICWRSRTGGP